MYCNLADMSAVPPSVTVTLCPLLLTTYVAQAFVAYCVWKASYLLVTSRYAVFNCLRWNATSIININTYFAFLWPGSSTSASGICLTTPSDFTYPWIHSSCTKGSLATQKMPSVYHVFTVSVCGEKVLPTTTLYIFLWESLQHMSFVELKVKVLRWVSSWHWWTLFARHICTQPT